MKILFFVPLFFLSSCDFGGSGDGKGLASSLAHGFAAGAGASAGHKAIEHASGKYKEYKKNKETQGYRRTGSFKKLRH
jgi:hypothetical protein